MADNTTLNPGAGGDTMRTEDVGGGVKIPVYKIHSGAAGSDGGPVKNTNPLPSSIADGANSGTLASVGLFHNSDNQVLPGSGGSLLTGGVPQITNPTGTADRARGTGIDGIPAVGITTGAASFAQRVKTSVAAAVTSTGIQSVTPAAMTGIQFGSIVTYDVGGANQEFIFVTAVTSTQFTGNFTKTHPASSIVQTFVYNQERDASGELDNATGAGTAVAAEYECNSGAPGGGFFDRARNIQGKGVGSTTLNGAVSANATSIVLTAVVGLNPGQPIYFNSNGSGAATPVAEVAYVDVNYVPGALTVPLQSGVVTAHTSGDTVRWDIFAGAGPGVNGFYAAGVGIEEEAIFDPVSGQFFLERAASADAMAATNVSAECQALWNGATMDRNRSQSAANTATMQTPSPFPGVQLVGVPAGWVKNSTPAAATQATVVLAAGAAGVRHVCTSITASVAAGATAQTPITAQLLDGATVVWSATLSAPVNGSASVTISNIAIAGTAATSMTIQFTAAGVAASLEAVTMTGYDIS